LVKLTAGWWPRGRGQSALAQQVDAARAWSTRPTLADVLTCASDAVTVSVSTCLVSKKHCRATASSATCQAVIADIEVVIALGLGKKTTGKVSRSEDFGQLVTTTIEHHRAVRQRERNRWLALGTIAGPLVFVSTWVILGITRSDYSMVRQSVSVLGVGSDGVFMDAAFVLGALLLLAGVYGVTQGMREYISSRRCLVCRVMFALPALGMLWAGVFNMNELVLHDIGAGLAFSAPVLAFAVAGTILRQVPAWQRVGNLLFLASPLTLAILIGLLTSASLSVLQSVHGGGIIGLWERALILEVFYWYVALGMRTLNLKPGMPAPNAV
jgi:hypothetical protein